MDKLAGMHRGELMVWLWHVLDGDETAQLQEIADLCQMSRKTASRAMISLEEKGVIWVDRDEIGRRRTSGLTPAYAFESNGESGPDLIPHLFVSRDAPDEVVKSAYRALSKLYHPDKNPDNPGEATSKMQGVVEAYKAWKG